ncbi:MAG: type 4a pilus biogenesis protein PilO [Candidatus Omnitrophica bacterium]|nr:type 4a pilus biogenesis protein PilO [Candidatus Omnitrophota bacterium]
MIEKLLNNKRMNKRERLLLVLFISAILILVGYRFAFMPMAKDIANYKSQIGKLTVRLDGLKVKFPPIEEMRENIRSLREDSEKMLTEIGSMERQLPSKQHASQLVGELTRLASDIELTAIQQKIDTGDAYSRIFVELKIAAPYIKVISYLQRIESISPFIKIEELDISGMKKEFKSGEEESKLVVSALLGEMPFIEQLKGNEESGEPPEVGRDIFMSTTATVPSLGEKKLVVEGITTGPKGSTAIVNGNVLKVGSSIEGLNVIEIHSDAIILNDGINDYTLSVER